MVKKLSKRYGWRLDEDIGGRMRCAWRDEQMALERDVYARACV